VCSALTFFKDGFIDFVDPEEEIKSLIDTIHAAGFPTIRVECDAGRWAKDTRVRLPHLEGHPYYYVTNDNFQVPVVSSEKMFDPEGIESIRCDVATEGAVITGIAHTPFMILSDSITPYSVQQFEKAVKENIVEAGQPVYSGLKTYTLPAAFATLGYDGQIYLIDNQHIDTVMGFIPKRFSEHDKDILLIDPRYHNEVRDNPEFNRFITEQKIVVIEVYTDSDVDQDETRFNPANFIQASKRGICKAKDDNDEYFE